MNLAESDSAVTKTFFPFRRMCFLLSVVATEVLSKSQGLEAGSNPMLRLDHRQWKTGPRPDPDFH